MDEKLKENEQESLFYDMEMPLIYVLADMEKDGIKVDKAALLAKKALLRATDDRNPDPVWENLEVELLSEINALGIGPQGFGGKTTALCVNIEQYPCHIASLPVAVNINWHVTRHAKEVI